MGSEYLKKLAKNQVIEPKRELTPKEKRLNWWYYHKGHVALGLVGLLIAAWMVWALFIDRPYRMAYVGSYYLPDDTVEALEDQLSALGQDINGDGQVLVSVDQYIISGEDIDVQSGMASQVRLIADSSDYHMFYYLMEDPAAFQESYELLAYPDGSLPQEGETEGLWYAWEDCPVLMGLKLGSVELEDSSVTIQSQQLLSGLSIGRRGVVTEDPEALETLAAYEALWQAITAGAD